MHGYNYPGSDPAPETRARIEIIPLIDVIFFLLATFVLFTLSLDRTGVIPITLPTAPPDFERVHPPAEPVVLQVSEAGSYYWDRELVSFPDVLARLDAYAVKFEPKVFIASDDRANYGDAIRLLDAVRAAGITQVSFETRYRPRGQ